MMLWDLLFSPTVVETGLKALAAHLFLLICFAYVLPKGPWKDLPSFTAHQAVALPLMISVSYQGTMMWLSSETSTATLTSEERITLRIDDGVYLAEQVFGFLLFWDIPTSLFTPKLKNPLMMAHHIGMLFIAGVVMGIFTNGQPRGSYYAPFFIGVIEFSTIFLAFVDVFHPKYKYWYEWLQNQQQNKTKIGSTVSITNEISRVLFAISFLALRFMYFPYITFTICLSDFWSTANSTKEVPLYIVCVLNLLFAGLQIHWGVLITKQLIKVLSGGSGGGDQKTKKEK